MACSICNDEGCSKCRPEDYEDNIIPMPLTEEEKIIWDWQYKHGGGFYTALMEAISLADKDHLEKIRLGFPIHVKAYERYSHEDGWWDKVQEKLGY